MEVATCQHPAARQINISRHRRYQCVVCLCLHRLFTVHWMLVMFTLNFRCIPSLLCCCTAHACATHQMTENIWVNKSGFVTPDTLKFKIWFQFLFLHPYGWYDVSDLTLPSGWALNSPLNDHLINLQSLYPDWWIAWHLEGCFSYSYFQERLSKWSC